MNINNETLPQNKSFGYFFSVILSSLGFYFFFTSSITLAIICITTSIFLLLIARFKARLLQPYNIIWFRIGILLSKIMNPIILGLIFFIFLTPIALFLKIIKRDELMIRKNIKSTWKIYNNEINENKSFHDQF